LIVREPRRIFSADLVDVIVTFVALFVGSSLAINLVAPEASGDLLKMSPVERVSAIHWQAAISLSTILFSSCLVLWRHGLRPRDVGWSLRAVGPDLVLGVLAFLVLAPPVYALQLLLVTWFESHHPLVDLLKEDPQPALVMACAISAVVAAPIAEEYLFRGMMQSWLEWLAVWNDRWGSESPREIVVGQAGAGPAAKGPIKRPPATSQPNPLMYGRVPESADAWDDAMVQAEQASATWWPLVASAVLFALLHASHGPDWIPLFFFAIGLGYLYRQTRRLLPCIVVHFLLNACSLVMFFFENHTV
jgi:membrane protease YdiL (CAAX protease family)